MYEVPFYVKVSDPGKSFHDFHSKISVNGNRVVEVTHLTPQTLSWLQNGGLKVTDAEGNIISFQPSKAAAPVTFGRVTPVGSTEPIEQTQAGAQKEKTAKELKTAEKAAAAKAAKAAAKAAREAGQTPEEGEEQGEKGEVSLDDLLQGE